MNLSTEQKTSERKLLHIYILIQVIKMIFLQVQNQQYEFQRKVINEKKSSKKRNLVNNEQKNKNVQKILRKYPMMKMNRLNERKNV